MKRMFLIFTIIALLVFPLFAQEDLDLEESLQELAGKGAQAYVSPIVSAFGANMNSGWYDGAPKAKILGLTAQLTIVTMLTPMDDAEYFSVDSEFKFSRSQAADIVGGSSVGGIEDYVIDAVVNQEFLVGMNGPTIIGPEDEYIKIVFPAQTITVTTDVGDQEVDLNEYELILPVGGLVDDLEYLPLVVPQLKVGTVYGTNFSLRYLPALALTDLGDLNYLGFGFEHNPKVWLPVPLPVDLSLAFFTQTLELGEIAKSTSTTYGITASKTFGPKLFNITPYAGMMLESSKMEFKYEFDRELTETETVTEKIKFELEGENSARFTLGSAFKIGFVKLNVDYSISTFNTVAAGISFVF